LMFLKRNEKEEESLLSRIAHAKIDSKHLSNDEAVKLTRQIFVAGNETTTSLISNLVWRLLSIDNLWNDFIEDKINIEVDFISKSAKEKIEKNGSSIKLTTK